jgi:hypothetical protein
VYEALGNCCTAESSELTKAGRIDDAVHEVQKQKLATAAGCYLI